MTYKEWNAIVMVMSAVLVSGWLGWDLWTSGLAESISESAWQVLWAIGYVIAFNIVAIILITIVIGIVRRETLADEADDERDRLVTARAARNAYFVLSVSILGILILQAVGFDPVLGPYLLFGVSMLAGGIFAASQFIYYRLG